jgi:hypothetical protein
MLLAAGSARAADGPFALQFDGVDDYVAVTHSVLLNNYQLTVTAWIKTTQSSGEPGLVNKYAAGSLMAGIYFCSTAPRAPST